MLTVFQGVVNIIKRVDEYSSQVETEVLKELETNQIPSKYKDVLVEKSQEYSEGIRNSSDLAARRKRYVALKEWLELKNNE